MCGSGRVGATSPTYPQHATGISKAESAARMVDVDPWHSVPPGNLATGRDWRAGMEQPSGSGPRPRDPGTGHVPCAWAVL
jgi:hypothetical protein